MRFVTNRMLNPLTRPLLRRGLWPRTQALIETTGRTSGQPRTVPVGNGLRGDTFWIVTEHGYGADYVKNIQHDPRMRVKVGRSWHHGTAHILADDDPRQRLRWLKRPVNDALLLLIGTQQVTIRVDLARHGTPPLRPLSPSDQVSARSDVGAGTCRRSRPRRSTTTVRRQRGHLSTAVRPSA